MKYLTWTPVILALTLCFWTVPDAAEQASVPPLPSLPVGYFWSSNITKPAKLELTSRTTESYLPAGNYDVSCFPVGDNWMITQPGAYTSVKLDTPGGLGMMPRFPVDEPSAGFLYVKRGPYADGTAETARPGWDMTSMPGGQGLYRSPMPVLAHSGARRDRYANNGHRWQGDGGWPALDAYPNYWRPTTPTGPMGLDGVRRSIVPTVTAPDVTILSQVPNVPIYVSFAFVDMLGRETTVSDPLFVAGTGDGDSGSVVIVRQKHETATPPPGCCGYHLYAGTTATDLHRQKVLDREGSSAQYLWPVFLCQFCLNRLDLTTPGPSPSVCVRSILNDPQRQLAAGASTITMNQKAYNQYCPMLFGYDANNLGRSTVGKAKFVHQNTWNGQALQTDIPLLLMQGQNDRVTDLYFDSDDAIVGVTFSDWFGGCAFSNSIERCWFVLGDNVNGNDDTYGLLVDQRATTLAHICSEFRAIDCFFQATVPIKLEGEQTANIKLLGNSYLISLGHTRSLADTAAIYLYAPNGVIAEPQGIGGVFRSVACLCPTAGGTNLILRGVFVDAPCTAVITINTASSCNILIKDGERINGAMRLIESPMGLATRFKMENVIFPVSNRSSAISFMLNQLAIETDFPLGEMVVPSSTFWTSRGIPLIYDTSNFTVKPLWKRTYGFSDSPDTIQVSP